MSEKFPRGERESWKELKESIVELRLRGGVGRCSWCSGFLDLQSRRGTPPPFSTILPEGLTKKVRRVGSGKGLNSCCTPSASSADQRLQNSRKFSRFFCCSISLILSLTFPISSLIFSLCFFVLRRSVSARFGGLKSPSFRGGVGGEGELAVASFDPTEG
ncbi:hypothetical protein BKA80DRAFT_269120 [Phyllosticta citrichinensis]